MVHRLYQEKEYKKDHNTCVYIEYVIVYNKEYYA